MRSGRHIGKIVISDRENAQAPIPVRSFGRKLVLRDDVSYLIVGGLKGLCGSLAIHLANNGAKHIIAMSRSGLTDARSQSVVVSCRSLGAQIQEARGDVSNFEDVQRVFDQAIKPVGGVIQGAMVLRVRKYPPHYSYGAC